MVKYMQAPLTRTLALALVSLFIVSTAVAQSSVRAKYLKGEWRMVVDLDEDADSPMERVALKVAHGVLDEVDIRMEFLPDNVLKVTANVFGTMEVEYSQWSINDNRELVLGDSEHFSADDTVWMFNDGRLAAYHYKDGVRERSPQPFFLEVIRS